MRYFKCVSEDYNDFHLGQIYEEKFLNLLYCDILDENPNDFQEVFVTEESEKMYICTSNNDDVFEHGKKYKGSYIACDTGVTVEEYYNGKGNINNSMFKLVDNNPKLSFPREMMVTGIAVKSKKLVQCIIGNRAIVKNKSGDGIIVYAEYEELPEIQEMTLREVCKELGYEIKIVK